MHIGRRLEKIGIESTRVIVYTDGVPLSIQFLTGAIVRIRTGFDGFDEASYTLVHTPWEDACDSVLGDERQPIEARP